jgi:hypothetical protein
MLLTLTASSLRSMLLPVGRARKPKLDLLDLPAFTRDTLLLSGFNLSTDLLVGADRTRLESIRERADRFSCSCLLLIESEAHNFGASDEKTALAAAERMIRVLGAAQILGCSAASLKIIASDDDDALARVANRLKPVMERAEKLDMNLVIAPHAGLTARADRVTDLLKKVGGFRIGTYPDFETATHAPLVAPPAKTGKEKPAKESAKAAPEPKDAAVAYLHRLTPYASAVCASTTGFHGQGAKVKAPAEAAPETLLQSKTLAHAAYELRPLVDAVQSVGYDGPLALDYRGPGDPVAGLTLSRLALLTALGLDEIDDDDLDLDDELMDELEVEEDPTPGPVTPDAAP